MSLATSSAAPAETQTIFLTEAAARAARELFAQRSLEGYALRLFISGSGCCGYQYGMALDNVIRETDTKFTQHGVDVVVDEVSLEYVNGATIDYVEDALMGSGFKIENPNTVSSCGCGNSLNETDSEGGCGCH